jgi:hypothetical protein
VRAMTTRGGGGSPSFNGTTRGRRLGGCGGDSRGSGGAGGSFAKSCWRVLAAPIVLLKGAVDEGAPLVMHGGFAAACILLHQVMSRRMPDGVLSTLTAPRTFERGVGGFR